MRKTNRNPPDKNPYEETEACEFIRRIGALYPDCQKLNLMLSVKPFGLDEAATRDLAIAQLKELGMPQSPENVEWKLDALKKREDRAVQDIKADMFYCLRQSGIEVTNAFADTDDRRILAYAPLSKWRALLENHDFSEDLELFHVNFNGAAPEIESPNVPGRQERNQTHQWPPAPG